MRCRKRKDHVLTSFCTLHLRWSKTRPSSSPPHLVSAWLVPGSEVELRLLPVIQRSRSSRS
jgi:hypothetical protein